MIQIEITGKILVRNTLLNFIGQVVPLGIAIITIPFIIRGLGTDRFGLLSLIWVVFGYFAIFDLGLGRAATKYIAEALGKGDEDRIPVLLWTTVTIQLIFGLLGAIILLIVNPLLTESLLKIPNSLIQEAKMTFYFLALSIPIILVSNSFSGVLQARQRFDLVNLIKIPSSACTFFMPLVGLMFGLNLPGIIILILCVKIATLIVFLTINIKIFPKIKKITIQSVLFMHLFKFGGWVTVSSFVSPILVYIDRFLIGSILSMSAVTFYTAPFEAVNRLSLIAGSIGTSLFPAFSALDGAGDRQKLEFYYATSIKYVILVLTPLVLGVIIFAKEILKLWLGAEFALESAMTLRILSMGVFINSIAIMPYSLFQGTGRPDIPGKFHLLELPIHLVVAYILINHWGITGAALASVIRIIFDTFLLFIASFKIHRFSIPLLIRI